MGTTGNDTLMQARSEMNGPSDALELPSAEEILRKIMQPAPFDDDPEAQKERDSCDYSIKITLEMARSGKVPRKVRVYADGIYDLFHPGHARQLMQAKSIFPHSQVHLLVGCCNDALTHERKGETVMTEDERYEAIRHCRYVDEIVRNAPWSLDDEFLAKHKIDFVAHDEAPYTTGSGEDVYKPLKDKGMFVATQRTEGVSTSDIVARIVRNYDIFIRRNLARGYSPKELNVSFLRGQRLKFQNKVDEVKEQTKIFLEKRMETAMQTKRFIENKRDSVINRWEETSRDVISAFLRVFGGTGNDWNFYPRIIRALRSPSPSPSPSASDSGEEDEVAQGTSGFRRSLRKRKTSEDGELGQVAKEPKSKLKKRSRK